MKRIKLTRGKYAIVDDEDYPSLNKYKWYADPIGRTFYAKRRENGTSVYMHRSILGAGHNDHVDQRDRNGLNNRRSNVRLCTRLQNMWNQRSQVNGGSIFLGVCYDKDRRKWRAQICVNYRIKFLGRYENRIGSR